MKAGIGRMFDNVIKTQTNVIGQARCVCAINDPDFQRDENRGEIHYDWRGTQFLKNFSLHARRRPKFPSFEVFEARDGF